MKSEKTQNSKKNELEYNFNSWIGLLKFMPRKQLLLSVFYGISRILLTAIWPFLLYRMLKEIGSSSTYQILVNLALVVLILGLVAWVTHLQSKINIDILKGFTLKLVDKLWKKMNSLDWLTFHGNNRVYYFDMLMVETWRLRGGVGAVLESLIINSIIASLLSILILLISLPLFLVCFVGLLLMGIGHYVSSLRTRPLLKEFHQAWRAQHHWIAKCVDQFDLIKMDRAYQSSIEANLKESDLFLQANSKLLSNQAKWRNINQLLTNVVRIGVFVIGLYWVHTGIVNLDNLLLTLLVVSMIQSYILQLPSALNHFIEAQESLKTISNFLALKDEQYSEIDSVKDFGPIKSISVRDLSYDYAGQKAIGQLDLDLERGKIYLWKGQNGSGKSTAAHILLGLLLPKQGNLRLNDQLFDWGDLKFLRSRFAFLNQHSPIFMGSLKENILFGHPEPKQALGFFQMSWLSGLLPVSDDAENRRVGERGEGLSGGEAKRVALIRELLRSFELLILDEPLNHLDEYAINEIKREIISVKKETIIIIISHQKGFESIADEIKEF